MKKLFFLSLLALTIFACKDDQPTTPTSTVNLNFKASYNGEPLVLYKAYDYPTDNQIRFQNFNFFVSNITLLGEGSTPNHLLSEVEFFDFEGNLDLGAAETALTRTYEKVPTGTYSGIRIDFGVPASLNNADAGKLPSNNPLRQAFASHFWSDWGSFIFMKSEGIYDSTGDGVFNQSDAGFEHHPGTDAVLYSLTKSLPITIEKGVDFEVNFDADVYKIYVNNGTALDLANPDNRNTQELSDMPLAIDLMSHWEQACGI